MAVKNLELVQCPVCKKTWYTNRAEEPCAYGCKTLYGGGVMVKYTDRPSAEALNYRAVPK